MSPKFMQLRYKQWSIKTKKNNENENKVNLS